MNIEIKFRQNRWLIFENITSKKRLHTTILVFENDSRVNVYSVAGTEAVLVVFQNQTNQYYKTFLEIF